LPERTPTKIRELLRRCLRREAKQRLHDIADARLELEEIAGSGSSSAFTFEEKTPVPDPTVASAARAIRERGSKKVLYLSWAIAAAFAAAAGALALRARAPQAPATPGLTASLLPPEGWSFDPLSGPPAFSPDGTRLAFVVVDGKAKSQLCVRTLATGEAVVVPRTETARNVFWSPDGKKIAFTGLSTGLSVVPAAGGAVESVAPSGPGRGGTWGPPDTILYSPALLSSIFRYGPDAKERTAVTTLDESRGESSHQWPYFLPDGRHFLFVVQRVDPSTRRSESEVCVQALGEKERRVLLKAASRTIYVPGALLYAWNGNLMAQPFDAERLALTGDPYVVAPHVQYLADGATGIFAASASGRLAYAAGGTVGLAQLAVYDRAGKSLQNVGGVGNTWTPRLSPDGKLVAVELIDPVSSNRDVWTFDVAGVEPPVRRTFDPGEDYTPVFSPDGKRLAFAAYRKGSWSVYGKSLAGGDEEHLIAAAPSAGAPPSPVGVPPGSKFLTDWSPDGRFIAFNNASRETSDDMWLLSPEGKAHPLLQTPASERDTAFSPDGRFVAYLSSETGGSEIYVRTYPDPGGKWQISTGGGSQPRWRRDGRELFYLAPGFRWTAVPVKTSPTFEKGTPQELFQVSSRRTNIPQYDVFADGRRFIVNTVVTEKSSTPLTLVENWTATVRAK
ncbi:MAG: hypothetical protein ABI768_15720, partial [Acidobacteriota bacterium]